jgi:hypothetical protein
MKTTYMNLMISILFFFPPSLLVTEYFQKKNFEFLNFYFASWPYITSLKKRLLESGADRADSSSQQVHGQAHYGELMDNI